MRSACSSSIAAVLACLAVSSGLAVVHANDFAERAFTEAGNWKLQFVELPVVQADLALTKDQIAALTLWLEEIDHSYKNEAAESDVAAEEQVDAKLRKILTRDQQERLGQIILQATVLEPWGCVFCDTIAVTAEVFDSLGLSEAQREAVLASIGGVDVAMDTLRPALEKTAHLPSDLAKEEIRRCFPAMRRVVGEARKTITETMTPQQRELVSKIFGKPVDLDLVVEQHIESQDPADWL